MTALWSAIDQALCRLTTYLAGNQIVDTLWSAIGRTLRRLVLLCIVGYAIYGGYGWLDSIGWISHREETIISAQSDWLVGESKNCWSATLNGDDAALLGKEVGYAMSTVSCDDGPEHKMKVTFYGRKVQPKYKGVSWLCTRHEVSFLNDNPFTCYQTGGGNARILPPKGYTLEK